MSSSTVNPASLLSAAPVRAGAPSTALAAVRQTAMANLLLAMPIVFFSTICFMILDASANAMARPFILLVVGAFLSFGACLIATCTTVPSASPGGNLQTMNVLSFLAASWYAVGSITLMFTMPHCIGKLQDGSACGMMIPEISDYGMFVVRCSEAAPALGRIVLIDIMFGVVAAYTHLRLALQGRAAMRALLAPDETTALQLKNPA